MIQGLKQPVADLMISAATQFILPRFRALNQNQIQHKSSATDLVTVADIEAEFWLGPRLMELLPGSCIVGEEAVSQGTADLSALHGSDPVWVIDPIDGTYNFVHGDEAFCSMIALLHHREVLESWIYFPVEQQLYWAKKGHGAWRIDLKGDKNQLIITSPKKQGALSRRFFKWPHLKEQREEILTALAPTKFTRCAGQDYRLVAESQLSFVAMATLTPWDHAPGTLLVQEAGGRVDLRGGLYDPTVDQGILITGGDLARMAQALSALRPVDES